MLYLLLLVMTFRSANKLSVREIYWMHIYCHDNSTDCVAAFASIRYNVTLYLLLYFM